VLQHPLIAEEIVRDRIERLRAEADRDRVAAAARSARRRVPRSHGRLGSFGALLRSVAKRLTAARVRSPSP
jgi:hypothetical protein